MQASASVQPTTGVVAPPDSSRGTAGLKTWATPGTGTAGLETCTTPGTGTAGLKTCATLDTGTAGLKTCATTVAASDVARSGPGTPVFVAQDFSPAVAP